ncbi:MAG: hypothetical protein GAK31_01822 [Stenotrophomonas maltophilia]|uniref:SnoaL-like domain-containing protein n=1 Tax=Stenotrophomonas maltophilia TaxID=40324 RepID=A0A7V8JMT1_STEMA|nr:MAG: hypothetical protein GAK31_01822 [Stenotrophomonas maltophilia]
MSLHLPLPLSRYFALSNGEPSVAADDCFAPDAVVHDEQRDHHGIAAIAAWVAQARAAYQHHAEPQQLEWRDGRHIVTAQVTGRFPGSPVQLSHAFVLAGDRIAALEIH